MTPENEQKKAYLLRYLEGKRKELEIEQVIEEYRLSALPSGISYDGIGGGNAIPHGYEVYVAKLDELFMEATAQLVKSHAIRREILSVIEELPTETERSVMRARYIHLDEIRKNSHVVGYNLKYWNEIDKIVGLSNGYACQVHGVALQHLKIPESPKFI